MACYDDFDGVWFSVQALRMYHAECAGQIELVVVDNHPDSPHGQAVRQYVENWVPGGRYVPFADAQGTAAAKERVFHEARGAAVLCMDSHVLLEPDAIRRLIVWYDDHRRCRDLLQGPLVYDDLKSFASHFDDEWRGQMWGVWACDPRAELRREVAERVDRKTGARHVQVSVTEGPPFEVPAQGMGVFSCRKDAWPGFNPRFRGFGGEEFYIHEKFRQAGARTLCLPFLRWVHRFGRPGGVPYRVTIEEKFRNYVIGLTELGLPLERCIAHFRGALPEHTLLQILRDALTESAGCTAGPRPESAADAVLAG
jgi:glycosyltransferase involved in cell wall biosynthesis